MTLKGKRKRAAHALACVFVRGERANKVRERPPTPAKIRSARTPCSGLLGVPRVGPMYGQANSNTRGTSCFSLPFGHEARKSHLVDLGPKLLRDLRLLGLHELAHHAENILPPLRSSVRNVQVVKGHVLHDLCKKSPSPKEKLVAIVPKQDERNTESVGVVLCCRTHCCPFGERNKQHPERIQIQTKPTSSGSVQL